MKVYIWEGVLMDHRDEGYTVISCGISLKDARNKIENIPHYQEALYKEPTHCIDPTSSKAFFLC